MNRKKLNRVAIVGIGGIGGYFGTKLLNRYAADKKIEIIFVQRGKHLRKIQANGLTYQTKNHEYTVVPDLAIDKPDKAGIFDLVLFCVKSPDLEQSALMIKKNLTRNSIVISTLNGMDMGKRLRAVLSVPRVLPGCIYISAQIEKPGIVRQAGGVGPFFFGPENNDFRNLLGVGSFLKNAGIKAVLEENIRYRLWEKYLFVCPFASLTSLNDQTIGQIIGNKMSKNLLFGLIDEIRKIARQEGVVFSDQIIRSIIERAELIPAETTTSMQVDFRSGKKGEIDVFTGYVVRKGKALGIPVPLHEKIYRELLTKIQKKNE
ncbi:MAG: 2-dehydropantoate 2-reductase [Candidatus Aminicenantes bacterium]|nr:2-dehydropantoate 2-reductase [Candidatus Aminicenantes bacterium]